MRSKYLLSYRRTSQSSTEPEGLLHLEQETATYPQPGPDKAKLFKYSINGIVVHTYIC
jgi:hypothetical protein